MFPESPADAHRHEGPSYTPLVRAGQKVEAKVALEQRITELDVSNQKLNEQVKDLEHLWHQRKDPILKELQTINEELLEASLELKRLQNPQETYIPPPGPVMLRWVDGAAFGNASNLVIAVNLAMMFEGSRLMNPSTAWVADQIFLVWYTLELVLKAILHQKTFLCGDICIVWWNWLDVFVVTSGMMTQWLLPVFASISGSGHHGGFNLSSLRALRLLRLLRCLRALKILKAACVADFTWTEGSVFRSIMLIAIFLNSILLGVELDLPWSGFFWVENGLLALYCFELFARLNLWGWEFFVHEADWAWNRLDATIVLCGIVEQWMLPLSQSLHSAVTGSEDNDRYFVLIEALKVLRLLRVLRLMRLLRSIKPLHRLMHGIWEAMQGMQWVILLTFVILYACAILVTTLIGHGLIYPEDDAPADADVVFGSVMVSMFNLFKLMNDDQSVVAPLLESYFVQVFFALFMVISNWAILAILTSVVSGHMISTTQRSEKEETERRERDSVERRQRRLVKIFRDLDQDKSGTIDDIEFKKLLHDEVLREELCDVAKLQLSDIMELFHSLSIEMQGGRRMLDYEDFIVKLHMEKLCATERSALRLEETLRALEHRSMQRFDALLKIMGWEHHDKADAHKGSDLRRGPSKMMMSLTKNSI